MLLADTEEPAVLSLRVLTDPMIWANHVAAQGQWAVTDVRFVAGDGGDRRITQRSLLLSAADVMLVQGSSMEYAILINHLN